MIKQCPVLCFLGLTACSPPPPIVESACPRRPNILFIAIDDLRCDLGYYGNTNVQSPNLDALAASGVAFTQAYCQEAVCNPSRASLMTGLRPDSTHVYQLPTDFRTTIPDAVTLPQYLRRFGYWAEGYGKIFHDPFPDQVSWSTPHRWPNPNREWSDEALVEREHYIVQLRTEGVPEEKLQRIRPRATESLNYSDDQCSDGAVAKLGVEAMRKLAKEGQPFFLAVGFTATHLPFTAPRKYWDLYDRSKIPLATNGYLPHGAPTEVSFGKANMGGFYELRDYMDYGRAPSPFEGPLSGAQQRELKHGYYAATSYLDAQVGLLLAELDHLGIADNTIVCLWSDHGWKLGEHRGWCKQTNYEVDTRAPLIIRAPRAKINGKSSQALVEFIDIYPTLCELIEIPVPGFLEGKSLGPILSGTCVNVHDAVFSQYPRSHEGADYMGYAMRTEGYRYVEWLNCVTGAVYARELYDERIDPEENENIANESSRQILVQNLSRQMWSEIRRPTPVPTTH